MTPSLDADSFEGASDSELRRRLFEAGDRRLEARSRAEADEIRRDQALLAAELVRRGAPLEEPRDDGVDPPGASLSPTGVDELHRPTLPPPDLRPVRPEERVIGTPAPPTDREIHR